MNADKKTKALSFICVHPCSSVAQFFCSFCSSVQRGIFMTTRRIFLRNSALAMVGMGTAPLWLQRALYAKDAPSPRKKILVAIFQRGAADGLNVVVPHAEKAYYALRPTISIPRPTAAADKRDDAAIDLDGFFGFHPALAPRSE